jgi:hypothetical protein
LLPMMRGVRDFESWVNVTASWSKLVVSQTKPRKSVCPICAWKGGGGGGYCLSPCQVCYERRRGLVCSIPRRRVKIFLDCSHSKIVLFFVCVFCLCLVFCFCLMRQKKTLERTLCISNSIKFVQFWVSGYLD